jgi:uncharacterized protein YjbI with pentapeptide repeats
MKMKIEIKNRWTGKVLFEFETENNTVKATLLEGIKQCADLRGAYLQCADLRGADLRDADLRGADLRDADLRGAYLQCADLRGADLRGADLRDAYLRDVKIKTAAVFTGLYLYYIIAYIAETNEHRVKMGCHDRSVTEWDADFWNNNNEFPNDGSFKSKQRLLAYNFAKQWLELAAKNITHDQPKD